jgi:hypothetical protein
LGVSHRICISILPSSKEIDKDNEIDIGSIKQVDALKEERYAMHVEQDMEVISKAAVWPQ